MQFNPLGWLRGKDRLSRYKLDHARSKLCEQLMLKVNEMEKELSRLKQEQDRTPADAPIIIENIYIDRISVDKVDYENNFGALGIRELKGQLNIGANYRTGISKPMKENSAEQKKEASAAKPSEGPRYAIKSQNGST
jgi:hypothetical protein